MRYYLVDKVMEVVAGERIRGVKNVTLTDEVLHDHFPDFPVMPGALILEAMAQLSGLLLEMTFREPGRRPRRALLVAVKDAKFHDTAGPGDQLAIEMRLVSRLEGAAQVSGVVTAGDRRIARATLTFALRDIDSDRVHEQRRYVYALWTRGLDPPIDLP
ncbi:MAG: 3-hydroxyacyl-ACP dehydratase FabZ family protein [Acidobacteriota bacterium]